MAKQSAQPPKGTRDFLPLEARRRAHAISIIREVFERYGFEPLETPALERLDTLLGKYGEEGDQLLFKVLLRGQPLVKGIERAAALVEEGSGLVEGRSGTTAPAAEPMLSDMGLRYDLTVPLARVYATHQARLPPVFKRYQIQPVWRADTPGKGRYREFYQCDVDVIGADSLLVEAEVVGAAAECLSRLGFLDFTIRLNHRKLLSAMVRAAGIPDSQQTATIVAIDKLDKVGSDGVARELQERGVSTEAQSKLLSILDSTQDLDQLAAAVSGGDGDNEGALAVAQIAELCQLVRHTAADGRVRFDPTLARGLGYYTGCIFEVVVPELAGSLGGGGRYDELIGMFSGRQVPACGFALGLERILLLMDQLELYPASLSQMDAIVAAVGQDELPDALALAAALRARNLRVDLHPKPVKPGKLRKQAEERGFAAAVWLEPGQRDRASLWRQRDGETRRELSAAALAELLRDDSETNGEGN